MNTTIILDILIKACIAMFLLLLLGTCIIIVIVAVREFLNQHRRK